MIESFEQFRSLLESDDPEEQWRARTDSASDEVWEAIGQDARYRQWVILDKSSPLRVLRRFVDDPDREVRWWLANVRRLDRTVFQQLARDVDEGVRLRVAYNAKCPTDVLEALLHDDWDEIRRVAGEQLQKRHERI